MPKKIGVEQSLTQVQDALKGKGYDIVQLKNNEDANGCDCCVISGQDENVMGIQNTTTAGSVIDARGLSADDVLKEVENRFR
jgi:N-dimethylarginine dimethylaminohydrolase